MTRDFSNPTATLEDRQLRIPAEIPEDFANAVATILLLGTAAASQWDRIHRHPLQKSLNWIDAILKANDTAGMVHADLSWWEHQLRGH